MSALLVLLLAMPVPSADGCADVFDRTERCGAVDAEALPAPVDPVPPLVEAPADVGVHLGWGFLAGSATTALAAAAVGGGSLFYDAQLAALHAAGQATPAATEDLLLYRSALQIGAGALVLVAGLFAGTSLAFFVFDPTEGRPRDPFVIEE